jgi:protein SCO1
MRNIGNLTICIAAALAVAMTVVAIDPVVLEYSSSDLWVRLFGPQHDNQMATTEHSMIPAGAPIGGPFQLTNQLSQPVSDATYRGKYMLVFFGYSHCPDDCPLMLEKMALTMNRLGPSAQHIAPVFITIDPVRDTSANLKTYLANFGRGLIGLTGSKMQTTTVAHEYGVAFTNNLETSGSSLVNHSTYLYLMGPDGKFLNLFPFTISVTQLTSVLKAQISQ